jgi:hypothetical protein
MDLGVRGSTALGRASPPDGQVGLPDGEGWTTPSRVPGVGKLYTSPFRTAGPAVKPVGKLYTPPFRTADPAAVRVGNLYTCPPAQDRRSANTLIAHGFADLARGMHGGVVLTAALVSR